MTTDDTNSHADGAATDPGARPERSSTRRAIGVGVGAAVAVAAIAGVVVLSGGGDDDAGATPSTTQPGEYDAAAFCAAVAELPRISDSLDAMGTPAAGMRDYAEGLDEVASVADNDTAEAASLLADRYRSMADAVEADAETAPGDALTVAAELEADADSAGAIEILRTTIGTDC